MILFLDVYTLERDGLHSNIRHKEIDEDDILRMLNEKYEGTDIKVTSFNVDKIEL